LAVLAPGLLAIADEALQALSPRRTASVVDLVCDVAGLVFFWWLGRRCFGQPQSPSRPLT